MGRSFSQSLCFRSYAENSSVCAYSQPAASGPHPVHWLMLVSMHFWDACISSLPLVLWVSRLPGFPFSLASVWLDSASGEQEPTVEEIMPFYPSLPTSFLYDTLSHPLFLPLSLSWVWNLSSNLILPSLIIKPSFSAWEHQRAGRNTWGLERPPCVPITVVTPVPWTLWSLPTRLSIIEKSEDVSCCFHVSQLLYTSFAVHHISRDRLMGAHSLRQLYHIFSLLLFK